MERPYATFYFMEIVMFALSVNVGEIMFELLNVLDSDSNLTLKLKVKDVEDLDEIGRRTYLVDVHTPAKIGSSMFSRLFAVHNRAFRYRTNAHTTCRHTRI